MFPIAPSVRCCGCDINTDDNRTVVDDAACAPSTPSQEIEASSFTLAAWRDPWGCRCTATWPFTLWKAAQWDCRMEVTGVAGVTPSFRFTLACWQVSLVSFSLRWASADSSSVLKCISFVQLKWRRARGHSCFLDGLWLRKFLVGQSRVHRCCLTHSRSWPNSLSVARTCARTPPGHVFLVFVFFLAWCKCLVSETQLNFPQQEQVHSCSLCSHIPRQNVSSKQIVQNSVPDALFNNSATNYLSYGRSSPLQLKWHVACTGNS